MLAFQCNSKSRSLESVYLYLMYIEVEIGFARYSYTANEGDDSVEVCVNVYVRGTLQRSVKATLSTEDDTATG